ncbi:MAG: oligosaccharide flippase family protein [Phycisphaerae bacterium]|nr:oligosaccharide flippase family protein [Phycisphaerae bacterium]
MRIRTRSFIIMFSQGLSQASTIALSICLVRMIDQTLFGTYRQMMLVLSSATALLAIQFEASLYYYVPKLGSDRHRLLLLQSVGLSFVVSAVSSAVMFFGADLIAESFQNPAISAPVKILSLFPLSERLLALVPAYLLSTDRALRSSVISLASTVGRVLAVLIAFGLGASLENVAWSMVGVGAVTTLIAVADMFRFTLPAPLKPDWVLIRGQLGYCLPLFMTGLVGVLNREFDKFLISLYYRDEVIYGIYSVGAMELPIIGIVTSSVTAAIMPNLVSLMHEQKLREAVFIWQEAARKCSMVIIPTFAFFATIPGDFIVLLYGPKYAMAAWPFVIFLMLLPIRVALYATLMRAAGDTKPIAFYSVYCLMLNAAVATLLIYAGQRSLLSFLAPSIGTVVATLAMAALLLRRVCRITNMRPRDIMRWDELLRILSLSLIAACVSLFIPTPELEGAKTSFVLAAKLAIRGVAFGVLLVALMWYARFLTDDERRLALSPIRLIVGRFKRRPPEDREG